MKWFNEHSSFTSQSTKKRMALILKCSRLCWTLRNLRHWKNQAIISALLRFLVKKLLQVSSRLLTYLLHWLGKILGNILWISISKTWASHSILWFRRSSRSWEMLAVLLNRSENAGWLQLLMIFSSFTTKSIKRILKRKEVQLLMEEKKWIINRKRSFYLITLKLSPERIHPWLTLLRKHQGCCLLPRTNSLLDLSVKTILRNSRCLW